MYEVKRVADVAGAKRLAALVNDPQRTRPVAVVSIPAGRDTPWIDAEDLASQIGDLADVYLLPTNDLSWEFANLVPNNAQVYGGAGRVYPTSDEWRTRPSKSPLRTAFTKAEGSKALELLATDALNMAAASGHVTVTPVADTRAVTGKVTGVIVGRAVVKLDNGGLGTIASELTLAGFTGDQLFKAKQPINGSMNMLTKRIDVAASLQPADVALGAYAVGDVVLAKVVAVDEGQATLVLFPQTSTPRVAVTIDREYVTGNPLDDLRDLMAVEDVVSARLIGIGPAWALVMLDIDDDEPVVAAPSLLPSGPPWIVAPVHEVIEMPAVRESASAPSADVPVTEEAAPQGRKLTRELLLRIDEKKVENAVLIDQINQLGARLDQAEFDRELLRTQLRDSTTDANRAADDLRKARAQLLKAKTSRGGGVQLPDFADAEQGFRFLVVHQWASRIPVGEQRSRPLPNYVIGPEFLESVAILQGISTEKIADVVVEIVLGIVSDIDGRDVHRLRTGPGGADPHRVRGDGGVCWRASLQVKTPAARRIHYWVLPGGGIELSRVVTHDTFTA